MSLSPSERKLLLGLKAGKHYKANPARPADILAIQSDEANPVGRRLVALGYAAQAVDAERPGSLLIRITDDGLSLAELILEESRPRTWREILRGVTRSDWIALSAVIVSLIALFRGN